uniref:Uncharacterized protein n=1 Tax=Nelumbo nucifera TaxID=4432 RepID=A0A822YC95_NELNU|nr:TPA_asm: hypothetical protein HUJ06_030093 [Nelumbo nucifera]
MVRIVGVPIQEENGEFESDEENPQWEKWEKVFKIRVAIDIIKPLALGNWERDEEGNAQCGERQPEIFRRRRHETTEDNEEDDDDDQRMTDGGKWECGGDDFSSSQIRNSIQADVDNF